MNKQLSTFEREMNNAAFKEAFEAEYTDFVLSEVIIKFMEQTGKSVRILAKETGLSPTTIQKMRSGEQLDVKLENFLNISHACGYNLVLEKDSERIRL